MKQTLTILLASLISFSLWGQGNSFRQTYVFEGAIKTDKGQDLTVNLSFLILLDSTIVGAYYYRSMHGPLKLVGRLQKDNSFRLTERNEKDSVTGLFNGTLAANKKTASGEWWSPAMDKTFHFHLTRIEGRSYWDYIKKNRGLHEYSNLELAIKERDKVLSIDVANQGLKILPKELEQLKHIVSINLLGNIFTSFPTVLSQLTTLDEISLSSNNLTTVCSEIGRLKNLRILIMNFNQLTELPKEIGDLTNLLYLEIGNNQLKGLPEEIKYLTNLQELHIERNALSESEQQRIKRLLPNCVIYF